MEFNNMIKISESPLIENQKTGYINFNDFDTPLHLISPPKNAVSHFETQTDIRAMRIEKLNFQEPNSAEGEMIQIRSMPNQNDH